MLSPLEDIVAGKKSQEKLSLTDTFNDAFKTAQEFLKQHKTITLPKASDELWLVTDGAVKPSGLGATLYARRNKKLHLAGYFSAKLHKRQSTWIPCEIEALGISSAIKHFSPYMIESLHKTHILTDSKPCVEAYNKLCRGQFSHSARVSTFLSTACRYQVTITHLAGKSNVPSDFGSRNAPVCEIPSCQICSFINQTETSVVHAVKTKDVINGITKMPFLTRSTWLSAQSECPDLRRTHAHLSAGTKPSKKSTNILDTKRYLNVASIAKDGLVVVKQLDAFAPTRERIIVPRTMLPGLLTALHIRFEHPTIFQLKQLFTRYFYALNLDKHLQETINTCHTCASLRITPKFVSDQSTSTPPNSIGVSFAADVIKRQQQLILLIRETVTSYTFTCLVKSEEHDTLRDGLITLVVGSR